MPSIKRGMKKEDYFVENFPHFSDGLIENKFLFEYDTKMVIMTQLVISSFL